jgi:uncharacterized protein YrrD
VQIALGQSVITSDGQKIGIIERVLLNPSGNFVEHVVVHRGITLSDDKVVARVAIERVDSSGVHLSIDADAAKTLPNFEYTFIPGELDVAMPDVIPGPFQGMIFFPSLPTTQLDVLYGQAFELDRIENNPDAGLTRKDIVIGKGADVISADGQRVGNVQEVAYGDDGSLETVVVQTGLVRHHRLRISAAQIAEIGHEEIVLSVVAAELPNPE